MDGPILRPVLFLLLSLCACNLDGAFTRATEYSAGLSATEPPTWSTTGDVPTTDAGVVSVTGDLSVTDAVEPTTQGSSGPFPATTGTESLRVSFTVTPNPVEEVGPVALELAVAGGPVDKLELLIDGVSVAVGPGPQLAAVYEALSSVSNGTHTAAAKIWGDQIDDERLIKFEQAVPDGGVQVWTAAEVPDSAAFGARLALHGDYTYVVGTGMVAGVQRMLVRCYVGEKVCWTATLDDWTLLAAGKSEPSGGVDIEVDDDGLVVAGNVMINDRPRRYHARLTHAGDLVDESLGVDKEFANGLALGSEGEIVVVGGVFTNVDATETDLAWWSFSADGLPIAGPVWPNNGEDYNEVGVDAAIESVSGRLFIAGHRDVVDANLISYQRQFLLKYTMAGLLLESFTSPGGFGEEELRAVTDAPDGPCVTGAATMGGTRRALTRCLSSDLGVERWGPHVDPGESEGFGVDVNRAGLIIVAGSANRIYGPRARVEALQDQGEPLWSFEFPNPDGKVDEARDVRCDPWGGCRWTGWQSAGGGIYLVAGELTP